MFVGAVDFFRVSFLASLISFLASTPALAQNTIVPDTTLGAESSQVFIAPDAPQDLITGGALRGENLFHSFTELNVGPGRETFFIVFSDEINNIFSRVTGSNPSLIDGDLVVRQFTAARDLETINADFFLINPNGIIFGENARVNVGGSFTATSASAIAFGTDTFDALNPNLPSQQLTIDPSAFLFNQIDAGDIISRSVVSRTRNNDAFPGLRVLNGENLTLLGGNVIIDGRNVGIRSFSAPGLHALGGQINLGAVGGTGQVDIDPDGKLKFPDTLERKDITLQNGAAATVALDDGGDISIHAQNINVLDRSGLLAGILMFLGTETSQAGDIILDANGNVTFDGQGSLSNLVFELATGNGGDIRLTADSLTVTDDSLIDTSLVGQGNAGNIEIDIDNEIFLDDTVIKSFIRPGAVGNGGNITVSSGALTLLNGAQLDASVLTDGQGNGGDITVIVDDTILLEGENAQEGRVSTIFSQVEAGAVGTGGDVIVSTGSLIATNGGRLQVNTEGIGNAGNLVITARDVVRFSEVSPINGVSSGAQSNVRGNATGNAGDIRITTGSLFLTDGAQLDASTEGQGNSGSIFIDARDQVVVQGTSDRAAPDSAASVVFTRLEENAVGDSGNIEINASEVLILEGGQLQAQTLGQGNAGDIFINAQERLVLDGLNLGIDNEARQLNIFQSSIISDVEASAVGNAGDVQIATGTLALSNGARISNSTNGQGSAGNIFIKASEQITLDGRIFIGGVNLLIPTTITSQIDQNGNADMAAQGKVSIETGSLSITNRAGISTILSGRGQASDITITASESITLDNNAFVSSSIDRTGIGRSGNINIDTDALQLANASSFTTSTLGVGGAGNISLDVENSLNLTDGAVIFSIVDNPSSFFRDDVTLAQGNAGEIQIQSGELIVTDGGQISSSTFGIGNAGKIVINARNGASFSGVDPTGFIPRPSALFNIVGITGQGQGGDIQLSSDSLSLSDGARFSASSSGQGDAGNIDLRVRGLFEASNSSLATSALDASGGTITLTAENIRLFNDSDIRTDVGRGQNNSGNILLSADSIVALDDSDILAFSQNGRGGNIILRSPAFFGENFQPTLGDTDLSTLDGNDQVDVNASGAVAGVIEVEDNSFLQDRLTSLPDALVDPQQLLSSSCIARSSDSGRFILTGGGSLPNQPGQVGGLVYNTGQVHTPPDTSDADQIVSESAIREDISLLQEPQGAYRLPDGRLILSKECVQ
ncbi:MAG: filamentous hemagglutinin N-terminal domain-containing protein [Cyanobacteria bacterium P01_H01_bin.105]